MVLGWRPEPRSAQEQHSAEAFPAEQTIFNLGRILGAAAGTAFPDIPAASDSIEPVQRQHSRSGGDAQSPGCDQRVFPEQADQSDPE